MTTCRRGHQRTARTVRIDHRGHHICLVCKEQQKVRSRGAWERRHAGHDVTAFADGRRICRTCDPRYQVDQAAVERAVSGDPPQALSHAERQQVVLTLARQGTPRRLIAERALCSPRTVQRILRRTREAEQRTREPNKGDSA